MQFKNLENFESKMDAQNTTVAFFSIVYSNCTVECIYSKNLKKFLFAIVDMNIGFTCSLQGFYANAFINHQEALQVLADCRNHGAWDPKHFYEILDENLPFVNFGQVTTQQYQSTTSVAVSNFEDRIYFHHWMRANISPKQIKKTIELMGHEVVAFCKETGVTPVYYDHPTARTLKAMENFKNDYDLYGTKQD